LARLILSGNLQQLAGGDSLVEIEAHNVKQLLRLLGERYPALAPHLAQDSFAVAVDGEIFQDVWFAPIGPDSEVHLIPAIRGG
jgi:molybdopterin synthase sulfur carrier subunit